MIHIISTSLGFAEGSYISQVFDIEGVDDAKKEYLDFLLGEAETRGIVINPHWRNIMNYEDHHPSFSAEKYKKEAKSWKKFLKEHNIVWFIKEKLGGKEVKFKKVIV
jgi:hypothetical protein